MDALKGLENIDSSCEDLEGILLEPDRKKGELAVFNPSLCQNGDEREWPFVYRTELQDRKGRYSVIDFRLLETPTKLSKEKRTIIVPEFEYEERGCEDPRLTKVRDTFFITYVAYDGINARIALATTKNFKEIKKHGIISPQIPLNEAAEIVGDETYKGKWLKEYAKEKKLSDKEILIWDKDAVLDYDYKNRKWILIHRLDPHIHIAKVDSLRDLQNDDFWRTYLKNIRQHVCILKTEPWEKEKVGWGSPLFKIGDKRVGVYHGVDKNGTYRGSFCELDESYNIVSKLRDPLLQSGDGDLCEWIDDNGKRRLRGVIFPTGALVQEPILYIYSGVADKKIMFRSTSIDWIYRELNHSYNRLI